ncbi:hypothetical protein DAEQUDRAFT_756291 [Daedalea quercina L-15889]|uniref:DUF6535 domain-containing protein n=1 Tax=Daedalea quercina L-15889 TaxID=1314783 RepID=A0A165RFZ0_9APHY|nr:hypothetical protein DAEQUDRAFT_756291 [Daedalea quercina L-15889]
MPLNNQARPLSALTARKPGESRASLSTHLSRISRLVPCLIVIEPVECVGRFNSSFRRAGSPFIGTISITLGADSICLRCAITSSDHEDSAHPLPQASKQPENSGGRAAGTATQGEKETERAWSKLATEVWAYEETRVKRWKDEISNLLIFAGLFSAVLTAFTSQYYTLIQLGPANFNTLILERQTQIFERMASQLANLTAGAIVQASNAPVMTADTFADPSPSLSLPPFPPRWVATLCVDGKPMA